MRGNCINMINEVCLTSFYNDKQQMCSIVRRLYSKM